jgi:hypothetical protein
MYSLLHQIILAIAVLFKMQMTKIFGCKVPESTVRTRSFPSIRPPRYVDPWRGFGDAKIVRRSTVTRPTQFGNNESAGR